MDKILNRIVNFAVLAACLAVLVHLGLYAYHSRTPSRPPVYAKGTRISDTADLNFGSARRTLILITASKCHFCQDSMPFYKRLTSRAHKLGIRVLGLSAENLDTHREFLAHNGIYTDGVASASLNKVNFHGTPTLIEVDNKGIVITSWEGAVVPAKEPALESSLIPTGW